MSKKKKIILVIAILSCVILAFIGRKSFSKYTAEIRGDATAEIAKWYFKVNESSEEIQNIKLASIQNLATVAKNKIAPGTKGSFDIIVDCTEAQVRIQYDIKFENETVKPTNLKFKYKDHECNNLSELEEFLSGQSNQDDQVKKLTHTIEWEWPFETGSSEEEKARNDKIDTQESQTITDYSFDIVVTGTQMKPN